MKKVIYKRIDITVEEKLLNQFKRYCRNNGMKLSTRVQYLMRKDLKRLI